MIRLVGWLRLVNSFFLFFVQQLEADEVMLGGGQWRGMRGFDCKEGGRWGQGREGWAHLMNSSLAFGSWKVIGIQSSLELASARYHL